MPIQTLHTDQAMSSEPKRHYYIPRFLLRQFAEDVHAKNPTVWWLSKKSGANRRSSVDNEAVIGQYYPLSDDVELPPGLPEKTPSDIEGVAAYAIQSLREHPRPLTFDQRHALALYLVIQRKRTPSGRRHFRFIDELTLRLETRSQSQQRHVTG